MTARKILVTGGAGFIGSAIVRQLVAAPEGHQVMNVDCLTYAANPLSLNDVAGNDRYRFEQVDIRDAARVRALFEDFKPDLVIHSAAESHVDRSIDGPEIFVETNVLGTANLLFAALGHWRALEGEAKDRFRFLHVSTDEVYGDLGADDDGPGFSEETPYDPRSLYSASKAGSDHLVRACFHTYGLPILLTNCSNNYGPCQFPEKLIPLIIMKCLAGERLPVYGTGENVRDWLYVEDHVSALWAVAERGAPGETYMIGGSSQRQNIEVVHRICDALDRMRPRAGGAPHRDLIQFVTDRPGHDFKYGVDASKIRAELGWEPSRSFEDGIEETVAWYLANEDWWRPLLERGGVGERLGLAALSGGR